MRKSIGALMCFILALTASGCAGIKTTGRPFDTDGGAEELIAFLDQSIGKATKKDIKSRISGSPEIQADKETERWIYKYEEIRSTSWTYILYSVRYNKTRTKELELVFKKNGLLDKYSMRDNYSETKEQVERLNNYTDRLVDGFIATAIGTSILIAIDIIRERAKK